MKEIKLAYRGFDLVATRDRALGGWNNVYFAAIRRRDGLILIDDFTSGAERLPSIIKSLKHRVDCAWETKGKSECIERKSWRGKMAKKMVYEEVDNMDIPTLVRVLEVHLDELRETAESEKVGWARAEVDSMYDVLNELKNKLRPQVAKIKASKPFDIKEFAKKVCVMDDRLGQNSDHEGDEEGPTYRLFESSTPAEWECFCWIKMEQHMVASSLWGNALVHAIRRVKEGQKNEKGSKVRRR